MPPSPILFAIIVVETLLAPVVFATEMRTISFHEGTQMVVQMAPAGDRLVAVILGQVWTIDNRRHEARLLTDPLKRPEEYRSAVWSPDSKRILASAFTTSPIQSIEVIDAETGSTREIPRAGVLVADPEWTADGNAILATLRKQGSTQMCKIGLDGGGACTPVAEFTRAVGQIALTGDGKFLAYTSPVAGGKADLWERDLENSNEHKLLEQIRADSHPAYSPDGKWIALHCGDVGRDVCIYDRRSNVLSPLARNVDDLYLERLSWTSDAGQVVYTAAGKIHAVPINGSASHSIEFTASMQVAQRIPVPRMRIAAPGETRQVRGIVDPAISPDGKKIALSALGDLWLITSSTGAATRLTKTIADESQPRWAPDGQQIAYVRSRAGAEKELMLLRLADPGHPRVLRTIAPIDFIWAADGRRIAYRDFRYQPGEGRPFFEKKIGWIDTETGADHPVTYFRADDSSLLGWSSDGRSIVYSAAVLSPESDGPNWSIRSVAASEGPSERQGEVLPVPGALAVNAAWSSGAERAAYSLNGVSFYVRIDSPTERKRLPDLGAHAFSWSSGGLMLLYQVGVDLKLLDTRSGRVLPVRPRLRYTTPQAAPATIIRNARIIDGTASGSQFDGGLWDILIRDGRIARIEPAGRLVSGAASELDAGGRAVLPGLFNLHWHVPWPGTPEVGSAAVALAHGVTFLREMGGNIEPDWVQSLAERIEAGQLRGPHISFVNRVIGMARHSASVDVDPFDKQTVRAQVERAKATGASWMKPYMKIPPVDAEAIELGHAAGVPVTSHFLFGGSLARGLDGKEHAFLYYRGENAIYREDIISAVRAIGTQITPTLAIILLRGVSEPLDSTLLDPAWLSSFYAPSILADARLRLKAWVPIPAQDRVLAMNLENVRRLYDAQVPIPIGTDIAAPWQEMGVPLEMQLYRKAGIPPREIIRLATLEAARCVGVDRDLGSVEVGKLADLVIIDGDPLADFRVLQNPRWVIVGGAIVTPAEIAKSLQRE